MSWINLNAIWKIVAFGLLAGAGLPVVYALGMLALARARTRTVATAPAAVRTASGLVVAGLCFLIVLTAIGWGGYEIYRLGHPAK